MRLRHGGHGMGLAHWMWRRRMGDAHQYLMFTREIATRNRGVRNRSYLSLDDGMKESGMIDSDNDLVKPRLRPRGHHTRRLHSSFCVAAFHLFRYIGLHSEWWSTLNTEPLQQWRHNIRRSFVRNSGTLVIAVVVVIPSICGCNPTGHIIMRMLMVQCVTNGSLIIIIV